MAMLKQPIIEKLLALRLHGMAESLKTQEQDPAARELSFLERLGLLVDQQWNWRENQALGRRLKNAKLRTNACVEDIDYRRARGLDKSVIRALVQESAWVGTHENVFVPGPTCKCSRCSIQNRVECLHNGNDATSRVELLQGTLDPLILRTLLGGPAHGHAIATHIQRTSEDLLPGRDWVAISGAPSSGSEGLDHRLLDLSNKGKRARFYRLTALGRKQLAAERSK
jgi:hypothetical protein